jgi:hypothetical protein
LQPESKETRARETVHVQFRCRGRRNGLARSRTEDDGYEEEGDIDGQGNAQRQEHRSRDVPLRLLHLAGHGGDEIKALKGDKTESHRFKETPHSQREERLHALRGIARVCRCRPQSPGDQQDEHRHFPPGCPLAAAGDLVEQTAEVESNGANRQESAGGP